MSDGCRYAPEDPWSPLPFNGLYYELILPDYDGLATVDVKLFAQGCGGVTRTAEEAGHPEWDDCLYKYYVWAFRNGAIRAAGPPYDPDQRFATTTYGSLERDMGGAYVVRVQITDASLDEGVSTSEVFAYVDSAPIMLDHLRIGPFN